MFTRTLALALVAATCAAAAAAGESPAPGGVLALLSSQLAGLARQVREGANVLVDGLACVAAPARPCSADDAFRGRCSPIEGDGLLARCASRLQRVRDSPAALVLLLTAAGLVLSIANAPAVCEWLQVQV